MLLTYVLLGLHCYNVNSGPVARAVMKSRIHAENVEIGVIFSYYSSSFYPLPVVYGQIMFLSNLFVAKLI